MYLLLYIESTIKWYLVNLNLITYYLLQYHMKFLNFRKNIRKRCNNKFIDYHYSHQNVIFLLIEVFWAFFLWEFVHRFQYNWNHVNMS